MMLNMIPDEIDCGTQIRQVICVPPRVLQTPGGAQVQDFRVLLQTERGRLVWFVVTQRQVPDSDSLCAVARCLDSYAESPDFETLAAELYRRDELVITPKDDLIGNQRCWGLDQWSRREIAAAIVDERFSQISNEEIRNTILRNNEAWLKGRLDAFINGLEPELVETVGALRPSVYNYLNTDCQTRRRNRRQALNLFPVFLGQLKNPHFADIRRAIDEGKPLIDAVARKFIVLRPLVNALRGTAVFAAGDHADNLTSVFQMLRDVPADWLPRDANEWGRMAEAIQHIESISGISALTTSNRLIFRECARRRYWPDDSDPDEWWHVGQEIDEFMRAIATALCDQIRRNGRTGSFELFARRQTDSLLLTLGVKRVGRIARRWRHEHRRAQAEYEKEHPVEEEMRWRLLVEEPVQLGGVSARQLQDAESLNAEGAIMMNCAATYAYQCMTGSSQIWSLQAGGGIRISTLETAIEEKDGEPVVRICEHAGAGNSRPSPEAVMAVRELRQQLTAKPDVLRQYLHWKKTIAAVPVSERRYAASIGVIITALNEVLPQHWRFDELLARVVSES
jgi:hypothetical protein